MIDAAGRLMQSWRPGEPRDMHEEFSKLTLDIAARTLFSAEVGGEAGDIVEAMHVLQAHFLIRFNSIVRTPLWMPTPWNMKFKKAVARLEAVLFRFIRQRRESGQRKNDLLSLLLDARDEDDGGQMTDRQVRDEAMTLFLAFGRRFSLAAAFVLLVAAVGAGPQLPIGNRVRSGARRASTVGLFWNSSSDSPAPAASHCVRSAAGTRNTCVGGAAASAARSSGLTGASSMMIQSLSMRSRSRPVISRNWRCT